MNVQQTKMEFQRQLRVLMLNSTPEEWEQLRKYVKPIPLLPVRYKISKPERLDKIIPHAMEGIKERCADRQNN